MSSYQGSGPIEEKKPSFFRRPVPMWAFLLLVIIIILILFVPAFFAIAPPTIKQPLVLSPDSRTLSINATETTWANFTVANLNTTSTISATATAVLLRPNTNLRLMNTNITLTISGVQTGTAFTSSSDGKSVSFPPGASTLAVRVVSDKATPGNYTIQVALTY